jgi:hypothetical protein
LPVPACLCSLILLSHSWTISSSAPWPWANKTVNETFERE